jgi:glycosyltransferase 2 family protein
LKQINKVILSIFLIVLFYSSLIIYSDFNKISDNFKNIEINQVIPILLIYGLVLLFGGIRQKFLLNKMGLKINVKDNFLIYLAGLSMVITPMGSGQIIKTHFLKKKFGYPTSKTLAVIIIERFCDLIVVSSIITITLAIYFSKSTLIVSIISITILGIFILSISNKQIFNKIQNTLHKIPIVAKIIDETDGVDIHVKNLLKFKNIGISLVLTIIGITLESLVVFQTFNLFQIELSYIHAIQIFYTSILGGILSFIPGGVGLTESGFIGLMIQQNISVDLATSLIIFIRIVTIWFATSIGFICSIYLAKNQSQSTGKLKIFNNPWTWEFFRIFLDFIFGLYKNRFRKIFNEWKIEKNLSVLDIGCGIGQYSKITSSNYLGVDLNDKYIDYCKKKFIHKKNKSFRCADVTSLLDEKAKFDVVLMVDFLHHIPDEIAKKILKTSSLLADQYIICFEPIKEQKNSIGQLIINNDRGNYIRPLNELHKLFEGTDCEIIDSSELKIGPIISRAILAIPKKKMR